MFRPITKWIFDLNRRLFASLVAMTADGRVARPTARSRRPPRCGAERGIVSSLHRPSHSWLSFVAADGQHRPVICLLQLTGLAADAHV